MELITFTRPEKVFGAVDPIGRALELLAGPCAGGWARRPGVTLIVGLVANAKEVGINEIESPDVYFPFAQAPAPSVEFGFRTTVPIAAAVIRRGACT